MRASRSESVSALLPFFALAYAVSWTLWFPAVAAIVGWIDPVPSRQLHLVGGLGPMVAAVIVTFWANGPEGLRQLAKQCTTGGRWIVVAILIPAGLFLIATTSIAVTTDAAIEWRNVGASTEFPDWPRSVYWLANVVFFGFGEEVGWRGFALPRLQSHASALHASLVLAAGWAGWHLPLFAFGPGLSTLGLAGSVGWLMSLALGSILLTWLFNASAGSIGAVAIFHAALDIFIGSPVAAAVPNVMGALLTVGTLLLIPTLRHESRIPNP
jgi:membrane protease YdiL (CAAX protease family)